LPSFFHWCSAAAVIVAAMVDEIGPPSRNRMAALEKSRAVSECCVASFSTMPTNSSARRGLSAIKWSMFLHPTVRSHIVHMTPTTDPMASLRIRPRMNGGAPPHCWVRMSRTAASRGSVGPSHETAASALTDCGEVMRREVQQRTMWESALPLSANMMLEARSRAAIAHSVADSRAVATQGRAAECPASSLCAWSISAFQAAAVRFTHRRADFSSIAAACCVAAVARFATITRLQKAADSSSSSAVSSAVAQRSASSTCAEYAAATPRLGDCHAANPGRGGAVADEDDDDDDDDDDDMDDDAKRGGGGVDKNDDDDDNGVGRGGGGGADDDNDDDDDNEDDDARRGGGIDDPCANTRLLATTEEAALRGGALAPPVAPSGART
jgi:hypothetical protein